MNLNWSVLLSIVSQERVKDVSFLAQKSIFKIVEFVKLDHQFSINQLILLQSNCLISFFSAVCGFFFLQTINFSLFYITVSKKICDCNFTFHFYIEMMPLNETCMYFEMTKYFSSSWTIKIIILFLCSRFSLLRIIVSSVWPYV